MGSSTDDIKELVILGRGGQGGFTAARLIVSAAVKDGLWGQAIPEFGAERRGAIVKSYVRLSNKPLQLHSGVGKADILLVFSEDILRDLEILNITKGKGSLVIVNSNSPPVSIADMGIRLYWVDATGISEKLGLIIAGWRVVNSIMVGAFARATHLITLNSIVKSLREFVSKEEYVKLNEEAVRLGYEMVQGD